MPRLHWCYWLWVSFLFTAAHAHAQAAGGGDDVIADPELSNMPSAQSSGGDDVIADPELSSGSGSSGSSVSSSNCSSGPTSDVHLVLNVRANRDLRQDDPREEIWETTSWLALDATLRRSESLKFGLGLTARWHYSAFAANVPDARAERYEFDVLPNAAFVDATVAAGLHVKAGFQPLPLGRFDLFSAVNVLSVVDLRDGAMTPPERGEIGQASILIDYDPVSWLSLRAIYVPFFMPHIMPVTESDYALFPNNQNNTNAAFSQLDAQGIFPIDELRAALRNNLGRSGRDRISSGLLAGFMPEPSFSHPQGAVRATAHGVFGEIAFTFATALEHLPTFRLSDAAIAQLSNPEMTSNEFDPQPIRAEYNRFAVAAVDAAIDVAPFSLGFELSYQLHRTLYAVGTAWEGDPLGVPVPGYSDFAQAGARIEYTQDTTWLFGLEAFAMYAVSLPDDPRRGWALLESGRYYRGVAGLFGYSSDFGLKVQLSASWLSGPSVVFLPSVSYDIFSQLTIEAGIFLIDGQRPPMFATPILSLGGTYHYLENVFVGVRGAL
jgi:hypothetical protein